MKDEVVRARVSSQLKHDSEKVLERLGMSVSDAIRLFLTQVSLRNEFPIELKVPNAKTLHAMTESPSTTNYENAEELFDEVLNGKNVQA